MFRHWKKLSLGLLLIWIGIFFLTIAPLWWPRDNEEQINLRLLERNAEILRLKEENIELKLRLTNIEKQQQETLNQRESINESFKDVKTDRGAPPKGYVLTLRRIRRDTNEFWWYIKDQLEKLLQLTSDVKIEKSVERMLVNSGHRQASISADIDELHSVDGYDSWRQREAEDLSKLVQKRLSALQNPDNCSSASKLVCDLNKGCGYGCQIHHAVYCFIVAYGTQRTLILKSRGWRYDKKGFEDVFLPLSDTCTSFAPEEVVVWPGKPDSQVVSLPIVDSVSPKPEFLPPAIPADLADRMILLHGHPAVWWVSQFLKYLYRLQPKTKDLLDGVEKAHNIVHPMVGVHIRRTDKVGTEAAYHSVDEYMKHVIEYFNRLEVKQGHSLVEKRVYVASDDPKVLSECKKKYPGFVFLGDTSNAKLASSSTRYNINSLRGVLSDFHMLSLCDYLVCTFSSQVCRIAYEIMQQRYPDASDKFKSLDDIWYFGGQIDHQQVAIMPHSISDNSDHSDELDLKVGDIIGVAGNHWDGFNKGRNYANNQIGLYPEYKTKEKIRIVDFPTYPHVKLL